MTGDTWSCYFLCRGIRSPPGGSIKRELTYFAPRNCYKKKRGGKTHYIGRGSTRDSDENYRRAWAEWEELLGRLVAEEKVARDIRNAPRFLQIVTNGERPDPDELEAMGVSLDPNVMTILRRQKAEGRTNLLPDELAVMLKTHQGPSSTMGESGAKSVGEAVERFLVHKKNQARTGQKSVGRYANLQSYLRNFRDFVGANEPASGIDAGTINDYYNRQLEEMAAEKIGDYCGRDRLAVLKQFVRWAWALGYCELPRNIESREMAIGVTAGDVEPMPVESLRTRVKAATGRLKLELLLMANCGMYQVDCSDLQHSEVDWLAGTITRKRSKKQKGKEKSLPTVTHYLWPSTLELLRAHAHMDGAHVLATRDGERTVRDGFNEAGNPVRNDATGQAYRKFETALVARLNAEDLPNLSVADRKAKLKAKVLEEVDGVVQFRKWPPMHIRKTGADAIGNSKHFRDL